VDHRPVGPLPLLLHLLRKVGSEADTADGGGGGGTDGRGDDDD